MVSMYPPQAVTASVTKYGASATTGWSLGSGSSTDITGASVSFNTTTTNTKWLVTVTADIAFSTTGTSQGIYARIKVDGGAALNTDGIAHSVGANSYGQNVVTATGRRVITLAAATSHTVMAHLYADNANQSVNVVTITAEQLAG